MVDIVDLALSNVSCRIFTVSSSLNQATSFIDRIRNLGNVQSEESVPTPPASQSTGSTMPVKIPWMISNKYYSADVHFAAHTVHGLSQHHLKNVPAVIFVWAQGEPYRHDIARIAQDLTGCEPEVCLAVRVPHLPSESESMDEDDSEMDAFLSSHGFEYVDATEEQPSQRSFDAREEEDSTGIPRIPRVLDALSTIMWPSMETKTRRTDRNIQHKDREFLDWAQSSKDDHSTIEEPATGLGLESLGNTRGRVREMQELARWLEEDDSLAGGDPWRTAASSAAISLSPTAIEFEIAGTSSSHLGFDDDFTVFVTAPAVERNDDDSGRSSPDTVSENQPAQLVLPQRMDLYRSLGSVSDFGGSDDEKQEEDVEHDDLLPTGEEIRASASRIFGITQTAEPDPGPSTKLVDAGIPQITDMFSFDSLDAEDDESYDIPPFDLSKVVGTLQEMKAEIRRMEDEGERRKAAARVALGLVYGLEGA